MKFEWLQAGSPGLAQSDREVPGTRVDVSVYLIGKMQKGTTL